MIITQILSSERESLRIGLSTVRMMSSSRTKRLTTSTPLKTCLRKRGLFESTNSKSLTRYWVKTFTCPSEAYMVSSFDIWAPSTCKRLAFASLVCSLITSTLLILVLALIVNILSFSKRFKRKSWVSTMIHRTVEFLNDLIVIGSKSKFSHLTSCVI